MGFSINTKSGGLIELASMRDRFRGDLLVLHVDQTANLNNGDDDASVVITDDEVKDLIGLLNSYLASQNNGVPYVVLSEPLLHPAVTITVDFLELQKYKGDEKVPIDLGTINGNF